MKIKITGQVAGIKIDLVQEVDDKDIQRLITMATDVAIEQAKKMEELRKKIDE